MRRGQLPHATCRTLGVIAVPLRHGQDGLDKDGQEAEKLDKQGNVQEKIPLKAASNKGEIVSKEGMLGQCKTATVLQLDQ